MFLLFYKFDKESKGFLSHLESKEKVSVSSFVLQKRYKKKEKSFRLYFVFEKQEVEFRV